MYTGGRRTWVFFLNSKLSSGGLNRWGGTERAGTTFFYFLFYCLLCFVLILDEREGGLV